ncbi:MAG: hypothetical protein GXO86_08200 [Chlorobi bacterium]|nr:hypothetical protein [Chlorobiota bacterium]
MKNSDGNNGTLQITFAMAKRNTGYYPALNGDFEYFMRPFNVNYNIYTNGILPDESQTNTWGKLAHCASSNAGVPPLYFIKNVMIN